MIPQQQEEIAVRRLHFQKWSDVFFPAVVLLVLLALWLAHLGNRYLPNYDSIASIQCAAGTFGDPVPSVAARRDLGIELTDQSTFGRCLTAVANDNHPPAYFLLLNAAMRCFDSPYATGLTMSALFGLAVIVVLYLIVREYATPPIAAIGVLCYGLSSGMFGQMLGVRHYTLMLLANTIALYAALRIAAKRSKTPYASKLEWGLLAVGQVLSMWAHYASVFELSALNLWLILRCGRDGKKFWKPYVLTLVGSTVVFSIWLPMFVRQLDYIRRVSGLMDASIPDVASTGDVLQVCVTSFVHSFLRMPGRLHALLWLTASGLLVTLGYFGWRHRAQGLGLLCLLSVGMLAVLFGLVVLGILSPYLVLDTRCTLGLGLNLWLILLVGLFQLPSRVRASLLMILLLGATGSAALRYWRDVNNTCTRGDEFVARTSRQADLIIVDDVPSLAPVYSYRAPGETIVVALYQPELLAKWEDLKRQLAHGTRVLYVSSCIPARRATHTRERMWAVIDRLAGAGLELEQKYSDESKDPLYYAGDYYAFYFVRRGSNENTRTKGIPSQD